MSDTLDDLPTISSGDSNEPLFTTALVLDSRLDVKSSLGFGIQKSGQNITNHSQRCSSGTPSGVSFDVVVPSLSTVISRRMVLRSRLTFTIANNADLAEFDYLVKWGINCAMKEFALQQLAQNISVVINNSNYTFEASDLLQQVVRLLPKDILDEYADVMPTFLDNYAKYSDTLTGTGPNAKPKANSPFAGYANAFLSQEGRGSYNVRSITGNTIGGAGDTKSVVVVVDVIEPLIMSPFLLSECSKVHNSQGIFGVQAFSINMQFGQTTNCRALRGAFTPSTTVSLTSVDSANTFLDCTFITPHASLKMPARNIVPYIQLQSFKTLLGPITGANSPIDAPLTPVMSNVYTLNQVPDSILICVRPVLANRGCQVADSWLPISSVNIMFSNTPGILSNCTSPYQLWQMSKDNGVNQTWNEFKGYALEQTTLNTVIAGTATGSAGGAYVANSVYPLVATSSTVVSTDATAPKFVATTGSLLLLKFGQDINLTSDFLSPGVIGQFSIQATVNVWDNTKFATGGATTPLNNYELSMTMVNSGFIVNSLGSSSSYLGLVSKSQVLEASSGQSVVSSSSLSRLYGAGAMHALSGMPKGAGRSAGGRSAGGKMADRFV